MTEQLFPNDYWQDTLSEQPWLDDEVPETQTAYDAWIAQRGAWIIAAAQAGYQRWGRGAIVFDVETMASDTEQPASQYVTTDQIEEKN